MLALAISIILVIFVSMWWLLYRRRTTTIPPGKQLPPGPRGLPIIGNLHMLSSLPHRSVTELAKKYGPIMYLRLGQVPTIVVSSPEAAEKFLKTHDIVFASRPTAQSLLDIISYGKKGIAFTPYGSYLRMVRKFCARDLLSPKIIDSFAWMRKEELGLFVKNVRKAADAHVAVDVSEMVGGLVQDMMCRILFGRTRSADERSHISKLLEEITVTAGSFDIADYLPFLRPLDLQGLTRRTKKVFSEFDKVLETIIDEHESNGDVKRKDKDTDFVEMLLSLTTNKSAGTNIDDQFTSSTFERTNVKAIIVDILFGAIDTLISAVTYLMSELIRHPRVMIRLQKELEMVIGDNDIVGEADLSKLDYLHMVVKESLRLYPVAPLFIRESTDDILIDGYYIPKKSRVFINTWGLGRDPNVWSENVDEFIPERFAGSKIELLGQHFQLLPFGSGRRGCPATHLGLITVDLLVAQMVHSFNWELPAGTELNMDEKIGLTLSRANHLIAIPTIRGRDKLHA